MTGREWKPGDVAVVTVESDSRRDQVRAVRTRVGTWMAIGVDEGRIQRDIVDARPLVVIDPESEEDIARLVELFRSQPEWDCGIRRLSNAAMQAALREFTNPTPTKPDEPTGLGAVVECSQGEHWVRVATGDAALPWRNAHAGALVNYTLIDVARVLSEGAPS